MAAALSKLGWDVPQVRPNVLFITADDMNWDAVGAFGCPFPGTTPNIDKLASEGMRFDHAHVTVAVCQPSRNVLNTGRYPLPIGGEGFWHLKVPNVPNLPTILRSNGYYVGLFGKNEHSTPYSTTEWDANITNLGSGRNPDLYYKHAKDFFDAAKCAHKPFYLMANSSDPHRKFYGGGDDIYYTGDYPASIPSKVFNQSEVIVPGFLPDIPNVRTEIAQYYSSVMRCDDTVGKLLKALDESGLADNTIVMFLSDNGMAFPFSKTNCYLNSTRTPWIVRWPGKTAAGKVDTQHMISAIDFLPTILDAAGIQAPPSLDGKSFQPLLLGQEQLGRDLVFTQFYFTSAKRAYPMRTVQDREYGYIYNAWSDGTTPFRNESQSGLTWNAMNEAAKTDPTIKARVHLFSFREKEEFFCFDTDPDALHNLAGDNNHQSKKRYLQGKLLEWMKDTNDPLYNEFKSYID